MLTGEVPEFLFEVNLVAVVRVRAADENVARDVVPTVLDAPDVAAIELANDGNVILANGATVTSVDFFVDGVSVLNEADAAAPPTAPASASPFRPRYAPRRG